MDRDSIEVVALFVLTLKETDFKGDIHDDLAIRRLNATDNSIYEVMPLAVIQPFNQADLEQLLCVANQDPFKELCFTVRGGGTGTNGQSLTNGIVIDTSRYMTRILAFSPEERSITVEPGVILSQLNHYVAPYGLFFAPHVSTADRATIGGMIATDAAGKGSLVYGKTADHILGLQMMLPDGQMMDTLSPGVQQVAIEHQIAALLEPVQDEITRRFLPLKRQLSGYNIQDGYQERKINWPYLIAGSEGTLCLVSSAKLKLTPIPQYKVLFVIHYSTFLSALHDAQFLIKFKPIAIESVDEKVQASAESLPLWPMLAAWLQCEGKHYISNFVEFIAETLDELEDKISTMTAVLSERHAHYVVIRDKQQITQLWTIRSLAVGLASKIPGMKKPVAFIEDAIVPPEHLALFVEELQTKLGELNLEYAMYGHVDVGCIHVRPALNLQLETERAKIRPITEYVIELVKKYNGVLWGEHGKGFRGEFVPEVFGPILYPILCQIKHLFDPHNRFNPGKLVAPTPAMPLIRIDEVSMRGELDQTIPLEVQQVFSQAFLCNGNGACFNFETSNVMCPSYKVTKDRMHSPKGRAMLVKQWLREKAEGNKDTTLDAATTVFIALNGCLGCKGCVGKCPTQVNIPDLRTLFLNVYHNAYRRRSLRDMLLGYIENILPIAAKFPKFWTFIHHRRLAAQLGLCHPPQVQASESLSRRLRRLHIKKYTHPEMAATLPSNAVVIFLDVFSGFLDSDVLFAALKVFEKIGLMPYIIYPRNSGKSLIHAGFIEQFKRNSIKLAALLNPVFAHNVPVVCLENSITMMFQNEMKTFARPLQGVVLTLAQLCSRYNAAFDGLVCVLENDYNYRLLPHCTEQALCPSDAYEWQQVFRSLGKTLEIKNLGCCGMAGTYGHLKEQQVNSESLFHMHWRAEIRVPHTIVMATGFSCRSQAMRLSMQQLVHPIEIIAHLLGCNDNLREYDGK